MGLFMGPEWELPPLVDSDSESDDELPNLVDFDDDDEFLVRERVSHGQSDYLSMRDYGFSVHLNVYVLWFSEI